MSRVYEYAELTTLSTIRLIKLKKEKVDNTIACTICHVDYIRQPRFKYTALSYVWGDTAPVREIYLIDHNNRMSLLPLHENLWRFLYLISDSDVCDTWIWTDRVCLNQNNDDEMAQQIPRMGEIFRHAGLVLAWLGLSQNEAEYLIPGNSEEIMDQSLRMETISEDAEEALTQPGPSRGEAKYTILGTPKPLDVQRIPWPQETYMEAYRKRVAIIRGNPYWRRIWIVQEIVNAKEVVFWLGERGFKFQTVFRILNPYFQNSPGPDLTYIWNMRLFGGKSELSDLLMAITCSDFQARRPHDRVYGLLGLVAPNNDGTSPLDHIKVDYGKSPWDVVLDAVLESRPRIISDYPLLVEHVLRNQSHRLVQQPLFDSFKNYLCSDQTSERHLELARLALRTCDALQKMYQFLGHSALRGFDWPSILSGLGRSFQNQHLEPTIQDRAILLGLALAVESNGREMSQSELRMAHQEPRQTTCPVWLCSTHRIRDHPRTPERIRVESRITDDWKSKKGPLRMKGGCGQYSADEGWFCDGRDLTCEIRRVGFRLIFRPVVDRHEVKLEICMQFLHTDATGNGSSSSRESNGESNDVTDSEDGIYYEPARKNRRHSAP